MTVKLSAADRDARTLTITAEFDAPADDVFDLWGDPRRLQRWWGPPEYPATVVDHALFPGGRVSYFMTGPEGDRHHGWWRVLAVDAPHTLEFEDGFADDAGQPYQEMPVMTVKVTVEEREGGGTSMTVRTTFPSREAMDQIMDMGVEEGMTAAMGQMDEVLRDRAPRR